MRIKKNDLVIILAGKERGLTGRVLRVLPARNRVVVEGRAIVRRHRKGNAQGAEGGIIPREAAIDASNVALYSEKAGKGVRVRARFVGAAGAMFDTREQASASFGSEQAHVRKVRFSPKTGEIFE